jgi:fluoroquinolone transport system permease protein
MRSAMALARNDLRSVRRDSLLAGVASVPLVMVAALRWGLPRVGEWLLEVHGFDLTPYHPLVLGLFLLLNLPLLFGLLVAFLFLEEREAGTLDALRVTPLTTGVFTGYRLSAATILSVLFTLGCLGLSGMLEPVALLPLLPAVLLSGLLAPVVALVVVAFAENRVEGMAVGKALGVLIVGPLAVYLTAAPWTRLLGVLPSYWPAVAFWSALRGEPHGLELAVGLVYSCLLIAFLHRRLIGTIGS